MRSLLLLSLILVGSVAVVGSVAMVIGNWSSVPVILLAGSVCLAAALIAQVLGEFPRGDFFIFTRLACATAMRLSLPLVLLFALKLNDSPLLSKGLVWYVVAFYLIGLLTDTILHARRVRASERVSQSAEPSRFERNAAG